MTDETFTILVGIPLKPGCAPKFLALLDEVIAAMKSEENFVDVLALQSADDPDSIVLVETWRDSDNFNNVQRKRHYRETYEADLPGLLRSPRTVDFYNIARRLSKAGLAPASGS